MFGLSPGKRVALAAAGPLIVGALIVALGFVLPPYFQFVGAVAAQQAIIGLSIGVVYNLAGMVTLAQVSLSAVGAWAAIAVSQTLLPAAYPWTILLGGLIAVPIGLLVGLPALRLRGISLAIVTLGFVVIIYELAKFGLIPGSSPLDFLNAPGWAMSSLGFYVIAWVTFTVLAIAFVVAKLTRVGLGWVAVSSSERAAASLGVNVLSAKMTAFGFAAFIAGCGGAVLIAAFGTTNIESFSAVSAMTLFVLAVMVGAGHWEGALILGALGAIVGTILRQFDLPADLSALIFALGAIDVLSRGNGGLSVLIRRQVRKLRVKRVALAPTEAASARATAEKPPVNFDELALQVADLRVAYGSIRALDGVSLEIAKHEIHGIVGPNGAGKSTFVDTVTGFTSVYSGSIQVGDTAIDGWSPRDRSMLVRRTFQQDRAIGALTPINYLRLASKGKSTTGEIRDLLQWIGCNASNINISDLDTRQRRNLMIAAALAGRPAVVLLDEPVAGLTEEESVHLTALIREIPGRFSVSVGIIEHDLDLVRAVCDRVTVLDFGRVLATGPTVAVLEDPAVVRAYMGDFDIELVEGETHA